MARTLDASMRPERRGQSLESIRARMHACMHCLCMCMLPSVHAYSVQHGNPHLTWIPYFIVICNGRLKRAKGLSNVNIPPICIYLRRSAADAAHAWSQRRHR
eukprot:351683-Chlamydomonas_euryale.AAC.3